MGYRFIFEQIVVFCVIMFNENEDKDAKMKYRIPFTRQIIAPAAIILVSVFFPVNPAAAAELPESDKLSIITQLTGALLNRNHYRHQKLDDSQSEKIFQGYFDLLDPARL